MHVKIKKIGVRKGAMNVVIAHLATYVNTASTTFATNALRIFAGFGG